MIDEETWNPPQPTAADLQFLERIGDERAAISAAAAGEDGALRRHLLATLDRMEEALCIHGHLLAEDEIAAGWQALAGWEDRLGERRAAGGGRSRSRKRPTRGARKKRKARRPAAPRTAAGTAPRRAG